MFRRGVGRSFFIVAISGLCACGFGFSEQAAAGAVTPSASQQVSGGGHRPHITTARRKVVLHRRSRLHRAAAMSSRPLIDNGGPVLTNARVYAVWWGASRTGFPTSTQQYVTDFLEGLSSWSGSSFLAVSEQYMRGDTPSVDYVKAYVDASTKVPRGAPSTSVLATEISHAVTSAGDSLESGALYLVFTPKLPRGASYCAWHSATAVDGTWIAVAYMPGLTAANGCAAPDGGSGAPASVQALINVLSHELLEATTDSMLNDENAWLDSDGEEIADKCAWRFARSGGSYRSQRIGSYDWVVQQEWSNRAHACV